MQHYRVVIRFDSEIDLMVGYVVAFVLRLDLDFWFDSAVGFQILMCSEVDSVVGEVSELDGQEDERFGLEMRQLLNSD